VSGMSWFGEVRISTGSYLDLKNWDLLQSGHALGTMTGAQKLSNADAIFVGVRACCWPITLKQMSAPAIVEGTIF